jgi:hypothetical protein
MVMFLEFSETGPDGSATPTGSLGHGGNATMGEGQGFASGPPPHPFIHDGMKKLILLADCLNDI